MSFVPSITVLSRGRSWPVVGQWGNIAFAHADVDSRYLTADIRNSWRFFWRDDVGCRRLERAEARRFIDRFAAALVYPEETRKFYTAAPEAVSKVRLSEEAPRTSIHNPLDSRRAHVEVERTQWTPPAERKAGERSQSIDGGIRIGIRDGADRPELAKELEYVLAQRLPTSLASMIGSISLVRAGLADTDRVFPFLPKKPRTGQRYHTRIEWHVEGDRTSILRNLFYASAFGMFNVEYEGVKILHHLYALAKFASDTTGFDETPLFWQSRGDSDPKTDIASSIAADAAALVSPDGRGFDADMVGKDPAFASLFLALISGSDGLPAGADALGRTYDAAAPQ